MLDNLTLADQSRKKQVIIDHINSSNFGAHSINLFWFFKSNEVAEAPITPVNYVTNWSKSEEPG